jgi:parallel beta-helix repeat protein
MARKSLAIGIIILFVCCNISFTTLSDENDGNLSGKTLYVDDDNTDGPWDGSVEYPYKDIQDAVNAVNQGGTIRVYEGVYNETDLYTSFLKIEKKMNLIGNGSHCTIINHGIKILADNILFEGFEITGRWGIPNVIILGRSFVIQSNNNRILNNSLDGIELRQSSKNSVCYNDIIGVELDESHSNIIKNNLILGGISCDNSNSNDISKNIICAFSWSSNNNGIDLDNADNNMIIENHIIGGYCALKLDHSHKNYIHLNQIEGNNFGIWIYNSSGNNIRKNNFIDNELLDGIFFYGYNTWSGNYWNRFRIFPVPIFGKVGITNGYKILNFNWINFDWHPAKEPYDIPFPEV